MRKHVVDIVAIPGEYPPSEQWQPTSRAILSHYNGFFIRGFVVVTVWSGPESWRLS